MFVDYKVPDGLTADNLPDVVNSIMDAMRKKFPGAKITYKGIQDRQLSTIDEAIRPIRGLNA